MGIMTKAIPVTLQRRAGELPCDGVKRYKVAGNDGLTYSQARAAILDENDKGGRTLKPGTAKRLVKLNLTYFRVAKDFVLKKVDELKQEQANNVRDAQAAPTPPEEQVDFPGDQGLQYLPTPPPPPPPNIAIVMTRQPEITMEVGDKVEIRDKDNDLVGIMTRNKSGYRCIIDGQEARSRSAKTIAELVSNAVEGFDWTLKKVS